MLYVHDSRCELHIHVYSISREIFHGARWRDDQLYQAPMVHTSSMAVYVGDFVLVHQVGLDLTCAKVVRFYVKVHNLHTCMIRKAHALNLTTFVLGEPARCTGRATAAT